jgi:hypothetical protein
LSVSTSPFVNQYPRQQNFLVVVHVITSLSYLSTRLQKSKRKEEKSPDCNNARHQPMLCSNLPVVESHQLILREAAKSNSCDARLVIVTSYLSESNYMQENTVPSALGSSCEGI